MQSDSSNQIILYGDKLSQPTRAVYIFLRLNKIDFEFKTIEIKKFQQRSEEFSKINPINKVPALQYKNKIFVESHNILRYLSQDLKLDSFYGPSLDEKSDIDSYLDWHHFGLRKCAATAFFLQVVAPVMKIQLSPDYIKDSFAQIPLALSQIETIFLKNGENQFINGNKLTIADISCYCELKQLSGIKYDFTPYKAITEWLNKMEKLEGADEANSVINEIALTGTYN
ncbi:hypothetical protein DICPUDRAFT_157336 [Dictyostelium purpureum]|uniref:Glutathione S-transferase n=1 Tax=Dictyostelium purpureum TaxID=5786 RepID=F0ZYV8_DICPU|nr:uncharacterized protein DICPUDRAFT_157336 [Dictyostelium purpureum]EGC30871.1 hypothetical protein DICPUDRAFT_157336 [Dictyostelium purpureum]|eukprot:XP_003292608.1 hypothetical protein DICPUDRAFT_157336 [Dictyostelium purpureum]